MPLQVDKPETVAAGEWPKTPFVDAVSTAMRKRRDLRLRELIGATFAAAGQVRVLDLGGAVDYWDRVGWDFLKAHRVSLVLLNTSATEFRAGKSSPRPSDLLTLVGDACDLSRFSDRSFDMVHSNSVIEHVGDRERMAAFAAETRRVANAYYVQTPNFWFPVDPHFYKAPMIHWMPKSVGSRLLQALPIAFSGRIRDLKRARMALENTRLLSMRRFRALFPDAELHAERFAGLPKSLIAIRRY